MSGIVRKVAVGAAVLGTAASVGFPIVERQEREVAQCEAHVLLFEDGSYMGTSIFTARGTEVAPRWDVTGPELQNTVTHETGVPTYHSNWPVSQNGQECKIVID